MKATPCRLAGYVVCDRLTGEYWPADCDSGICPTCGINRARVRARLITARTRDFEHPRFITFTVAPEDWQQRRMKVRDLARRIRNAGYQNQWIWVTERGKKTGMIHVHAIQHGDYLPQAMLQEMWGDLRVDIRSARARHGEYISKSAARIASYQKKTAEGDLDAALDLNGGRLHHWSRGFFPAPIREYRKSLTEQIPRDCVLVFAPDARQSLGA